MVTTSRSNLQEKLILGGILIWIVLVFTHYFSLRKVFDFSFALHAFSGLRLISLDKLAANGTGALKTLLYSSLIGFTLWRLGRKVFYWLGLGMENIPLRFSMEMALGILLSNSLWLGLGLNGLWFDSLLLPLALVLLGWGLWDFFRNYMKFQKFPRFEWPGQPYLLLGGLGLLSFALAVAHGFLPENYFDGLVYHLATLSFWKFHHGIADFHTNLYSYYPFGAELYFLNGFFFQGSETAKTLNALALGLCGLAAAGWVAEEVGAARGILAWTMVLTLPLASATVWTTQNDVVLALFLILFYYALVRWEKEKLSWRWALVAGILGGGALTVKYTAGIGILAGILALGLTQGETFRVKHWPRWGLLKGLLWLALVPWLLKNFLYTGNPLYPYFSIVMGGREFPAEKMASLMVDHAAALGADFSPLKWLERVLTRELDSTTAPLLFSFLPFLFLPAKRRPTVKYLAVLTALFLTGGFLVSYQPRLMIPAFVVFFILAAMALGDLKKPGWTPVGAVVVAVFGLISLLSLGRLSVNYYNADQFWTGKQTREEYLAVPVQTASYMGLTKEAGVLLPPQDQLLIVGDSRGLYYPRPFYTNSVFDPQVLTVLARKEKDGEGIWKGLRKMGIDDLVISGQEGLRVAGPYGLFVLQQAEWKRLDDFIQTRTDLVYVEGPSGIYRLRAEPTERKSLIPNLLTLFQSPR